MKLRDILFQIHLWIGLVLCAPLVVLGVTGSVLVFHDEIDRAMHPRPVISSSGAGEMRPLDEIAQAALAAGPKGARVTNFALPEAPGAPAELRVGKGPRGGETISVDPATLAVLAHEKPGGATILGVLHRLHGNLLISGRDGRNIVGVLGIAMCALGFSGIVLWWPRPGRWKGAFTVKRGAKGYRFDRDLHGASGIWALAVFLIVSVSGVYISFPQTGAALTGAVLPGRDLRASANALSVEAQENAAQISFARAAHIAQGAAPDARLMSIAPSLRPDQPTRAGLAQPGWKPGAPFITVYLNPYTGAVIETRDPRRYTAGETVQAWQRAVHEGSGLGIVWKLLVFAVGFTPVIFAITGVSMWVRKRKSHAALNRADVEPVG